MQEKLTALIINAAMDPNPTREFIFGDPLKNAFRPSESKSEKGFICYDQLSDDSNASKRY